MNFVNKRNIDPKKPARTANIALAIVGLKVIHSTFVHLSGIHANVGLTFFKCPTIGNTQTVNPTPD
jgi:hypothetical protein